MNVPSGYKQTKVGVIPEDWEEYQLKDILNLTLEPLKMEDEKEYELITVRRRFGGVDSRGLFKGKEILVKNQFYVHEDDFVISKRQISHGACGLVPKELDGAIVSNEYNVFKPNKNLLNQEFFNYYVRLPKFSQTFYNYSDGVHIEKLLFKTQSWLKQKIPFPPLKEQQKIAQILSTWDDAISKQEALIKAKEELKKGLMQKLLSGEVRFDGFDGEWKEVKLKDVTKVNQGLQIPISKRHLDDGEDRYFYITVKFLKSNSKEKYFIEKPQESVICTEDDILMTRTGSTGMVITNISGVFHNNFFKINFNQDKLFRDFLLYFLKNDHTQFLLKAYAGTTTIPDLTHTDFYSIKINFPSMKEQQKIAQVLTLADKEIELLKEDLEALKEQKCGLMQRLLSGVVRTNNIKGNI